MEPGGVVVGVVLHVDSPAVQLVTARASTDCLHANPDVATFAPVGSPRVLDEPVGLATLATIADEEHSVINSLFASAVVQNSIVIVSEVWVASGQMDEDWSYLDVSLPD